MSEQWLAGPVPGWDRPVEPVWPAGYGSERAAGQVVAGPVEVAAVEDAVGSEAGTDGAGGQPGRAGEGRPGGAGGRRRRRLSGEAVRSETLRVRVSSAERAVIAGAAAAGGVSVGAWLAGVGLRAAVTGAGAPDGSAGTPGDLSAALAGVEGAPPAGGSRPVVVSGTDVAVEALREAVVALNRYGRLLNQLVAGVSAGGDVAGLAGGLRLAVDRCGQRSAAVATRAGELVALASSSAASGGSSAGSSSTLPTAGGRVTSQ